MVLRFILPEPRIVNNEVQKITFLLMVTGNMDNNLFRLLTKFCYPTILKRKIRNPDLSGQSGLSRKHKRKVSRFLKR